MKFLTIKRLLCRLKGSFILQNCTKYVPLNVFWYFEKLLVFIYIFPIIWTDSSIADTMFPLFFITTHYIRFPMAWIAERAFHRWINHTVVQWMTWGHLNSNIFKKYVKLVVIFQWQILIWKIFLYGNNYITWRWCDSHDNRGL